MTSLYSGAYGSAEQQHTGFAVEISDDYTLPIDLFLRGDGVINNNKAGTSVITLPTAAAIVAAAGGSGLTTPSPWPAPLEGKFIVYNEHASGKYQLTSSGSTAVGNTFEKVGAATFEDQNVPMIVHWKITSLDGTNAAVIFF
jgi:hypothetical protein